NILRGLNAELGPDSNVYKDASLLSENLFNAPSVFSYFSPQYRISGGLLAPEFQIYSTQTAATRANLVDAALYGKLDKSTVFDLTPFELTGGTSGLVDYISRVFLHHAMSPALEQAVIDAANAAAEASKVNPKAQVQAALYTVLTSAEYQIIR